MLLEMAHPVLRRLDTQTPRTRIPERQHTTALMLLGALEHEVDHVVY
jgi:hypothetical protein